MQNVGPAMLAYFRKMDVQWGIQSLCIHPSGRSLGSIPYMIQTNSLKNKHMRHHYAENLKVTVASSSILKIPPPPK